MSLDRGGRGGCGAERCEVEIILQLVRTLTAQRVGEDLAESRYCAFVLSLVLFLKIEKYLNNKGQPSTIESNSKINPKTVVAVAFIRCWNQTSPLLQRWWGWRPTTLNVGVTARVGSRSSTKSLRIR